MTSIPTTADLLRLLREDPDFRDEVRRLVLSQELLDLPERFARFEAHVERRFEGLERRLNSIDNDLGGLKGAEYERRIGKSFASYASMAFRNSVMGVACAGTVCSTVTFSVETANLRS